MKRQLQPLHEEILRILRRKQTSYARPMNSKEIGEKLNIAPCYIRKQLGALVVGELVGVRRGSGGGYYINSERRDMEKLNAIQNQLKYLQDLKESLIDMREYIPRLLKGLSRIAFTLQTGEGENAHKLLAQALEGIGWYLKLLSASQSILGINFQECEIGSGQTVSEIVDKIISVTSTLFEAYQTGDMTLTADIIEYELIPILETANAVISELIRNVENKMAS